MDVVFRGGVCFAVWPQLLGHTYCETIQLVKWLHCDLKFRGKYYQNDIGKMYHVGSLACLMFFATAFVVYLLYLREGKNKGTAGDKATRTSAYQNLK